MIVMTDIALDTEAGWAHRTHFESRPNAALAARAAGGLGSDESLTRDEALAHLARVLAGS